MRKKNIFLAVVLSAAIVSSSVTPAFAESLSDGETAVMEMTEDPQTEQMDVMQEEIQEAEQNPVLTESPEELPIEETEELPMEGTEELPMEETEESPQEEIGELENEADALLEAPEMTEENPETEEYRKEMIAQTSAPAETAGSTEMAVGYGMRTAEKVYYNAYDLYDNNDKFIGIQIDQFSKPGEQTKDHIISYIWSREDEAWAILEYSDAEGGLLPVEITGTYYFNIWTDMYWLLSGQGYDAYPCMGYQLDTTKAVWDYTYTANDVKKDIQHKEWGNTLDAPDAFYKGARADRSKHAGLRPISGNTYYLMKDGTMVRNKKMTVNGKVYLFGKDCKCYKSYVPVEEKWIKKPDGYYWQQDDGTILREGGWQTLGGSKYFLAYKSGRRKTGWQTWKGNTYYMAPATGRLVTGLKTIEGNTYFLQFKTGEMVKGWKTIGKDRYYFNEKTGIMKRGMLTLNGKKYYFDKGKNVDGKQHFGWKSISGKAYFFDRKTGVMKQNTWIIDGKDKYYANKNGSRFSGIRSIKGKNYYFHTDGKLVTNKKGYKINGKKYNIDKNGVLTLIK